MSGIPGLLIFLAIGNLLVMLYSFGFYFFLVKITLSILFIRVTHVVAHVDGKKESMSEKVISFC